MTQKKISGLLEKPIYAIKCLTRNITTIVNVHMRVYVFSSRISCGKNGVFTGGKAVAYAWFIWEKGVTRDPVIKWID